MKKVGLLGGSFDPPHRGHLFISLEAKKVLKLSEIWWLVTPKNPLKINNPASYLERINNCNKFVKNHPIKIKQYEKKKIAGFHQVGAVMTTSSTGGVVHPETDEEDIKIIKNVLGVNIEAATINGGVPFLSSGILANSKSMVVGTLTNGPETVSYTHLTLPTKA